MLRALRVALTAEDEEEEAAMLREFLHPDNIPFVFADRPIGEWRRPGLPARAGPSIKMRGGRHNVREIRYASGRPSEIEWNSDDGNTYRLKPDSQLYIRRGGKFVRAWPPEERERTGRNHT